MKHLLLSLALLFTFDPSPSPGVEFYRCHAWERHMEVVPLVIGETLPPCIAISHQTTPCQIMPATMSGGHIYEAHTPDFPLGTVVYGCVEAVRAGLVSECIGWSEP